MATFLSEREIARLFERTGARPFWSRLVDYLARDFARWAAFDKSPRFASHSPGGVIELMPTSDGETFAFKYVNGHPGNTRLGLQTVVAFGALADVRTGYPFLLSEMTIATALRTAATSVLAARRLARPESRTMALIGLGAQAEFQADAFRRVLGVDRLRVFDVDPGAHEKFERNMASREVTITHCESAREAACGADIVTTITADKKRATILDETMIAPGTHINAVGGDCPGKTELSRALLLRSDIFVEYAPQTRLEGEIQQLDPAHPVAELHDVLSGRRPGRVSADAVTVFDSVGFAVEDFSVLRLLYDLAQETGVGTDIALTASPADPKNLFALLRAGPATADAPESEAFDFSN
ncbi:ornithine cyclodeaminase [Methylocystis parvus]|uniref:Ornithine cyclodeaminase n=1 Tax=Methylocystis parvus TaxID=134 RepID=A0A6B8LWR6_9HYPH|nr:ornithine cyclodeaminase [Methylocystis parvus]QGM96817.1 ornithine cyclodeaminase [Methylocystis parvus]WBJ99305.1 ornithine cyclodeaminase [Methylocystis parvus OBBP]